MTQRYAPCEYEAKTTGNMLKCKYEGGCNYKKSFRKTIHYCWREKMVREQDAHMKKICDGIESRLTGGTMDISKWGGADGNRTI